MMKSRYVAHGKREAIALSPRAIASMTSAVARVLKTGSITGCCRPSVPRTGSAVAPRLERVTVRQDDVAQLARLVRIARERNLERDLRESFGELRRLRQRVNRVGAADEEHAHGAAVHVCCQGRQRLRAGRSTETGQTLVRLHRRADVAGGLVDRVQRPAPRGARQACSRRQARGSASRCAARRRHAGAVPP